VSRQLVSATDVRFWISVRNLSEKKVQTKRFTFPVSIGSESITIGKYERETKDEFQRDVKEHARIVFTNPDSMHFKILPHMKTNTGDWRPFFKNLKFVVLDEIHTYRGVFGANVAYVIRRIRLMCKQLGATPRFICASATLPCPKDHAELLVGEPFICVDQDGAPQAGKVFALWNPGFTDARKTERREPSSDAIDLLSRVILKKDRSIQTITFARSLRSVQTFNTLLKRQLRRLRSPEVDRVATYTAQLASPERNEIQTGLINRRITHVTATTALELRLSNNWC
jgi:DEAD/DEAH box helicase domain-containing protein